MASAFPSPAELIPHRPPMLLLRTVWSHEANRTECEGWLDAEFARFGGGEVSAAFALEMIAQAAAVHHGLRQRGAGSERSSATRGLLLGSRRLQLAARILPVGQSLRVTIRSDNQPSEAGGMIRFEGSVFSASGEMLATGDATVLEWRPESEAA